MLILTDSVKWIVGRCNALYGHRLATMDSRHYNVGIGTRNQRNYIDGI